ncbi:MAG TPA: 2-amino-4-hydroxy-6-hydroxymethyldihydropteridine diphosphokinase [bacterium]|nr:2-amino-4-hydroxy-6-hydroxymethyldihydropteridine diphosphokinase [bacterium]
MRYLLSLGSNIGDRTTNIDAALRLLDERGVTIQRRSSLYRTAPVEAPPQEDFVNAVALVETPLSPEELLDLTTAIETALGRTRTAKNGPRIIDIDIVLSAAGTYRSPRIEIPHPRWRQRRFVVEPAREIADGTPFADPVAAIDTRSLTHQRIERIPTEALP